ncbi:MAG TPA: cardiolipin synthase [Phycisphaerales bacterium]|nr:cardiolipin synthase [Phycisphaerales bacterium]
MEWTGWAYLAAEWTVRLVMLPVAVRRRRPSSAMAWLLLIFLIPWLGLVAYLLVGRQRLGRARCERARRAHEVVRRATEAHASAREHTVHPHYSSRQADLVAVAEKIGQSPILGGNALEGVADTEEAIKRIIEDIDQATSHVHVLIYIYGDDRTGRRVGEALMRAAARGVCCRVLVDAVGSKRMLRGLAPRLREGGVEVVALLPVNLARLLLSRLDIRNHRKQVIIDGRTAWTGSQNIVDPDYGRKNAPQWRDLMLRVRGPAVLALQRVFLEDWYAETGRLLGDDEHGSILPAPETPGESAVQVVPSGPHMLSRTLQDLYLAGIQEGERRIIITSPYFVPDEPVMAALRVAVMRGVRVDIIVPAKTDNAIVNAASRAYFRELVLSGANIHLHRDGLLHSKTMCVDDSFAMIGSSNFDIRSFDINFELNLLIFGPAVTTRLRALQERYITESTLMTERDATTTTRVRRYAEDFARLFSPLL